jgi:hypothetical protein
MNHQLPPPRVTAVDVLYLDFDGVLHPHDVWLNAQGVPYVRWPRGRRLFEHAPALAALLKPYPRLRIVLSTTWVRRFGYQRAIEYLPSALQKRCVGANWHHSMLPYRFDYMTRGEQVLDDVGRRHPTNWLAIDDDTEGWGAAEASHLVAADPTDGLSHAATYQRLSESLERFWSGI